MDTFLLSHLLDERNLPLWQSVTQVFPVQVQPHPRTHHLFSVDECTGYIFLGENDRTPAPFTHELLHLYLRSKRIFLTEFLIRMMRVEPLLHWTFAPSLFEQVGHSMEHVKMLPLFLRAGMNRTDFTEDFQLPICNPMLLQLIEGGLSKPVPSVISADLFIRTFIRIKCHPDAVVNYGFYLQRLDQINPPLYALLDRFFQAWQAFNIDAYHPDRNSYTGFSREFTHALGAWTILTIHSKEKKACPI
jgi:hypothetical protein